MPFLSASVVPTSGQCGWPNKWRFQNFLPVPPALHANRHRIRHRGATPLPDLLPWVYVYSCAHQLIIFKTLLFLQARLSERENQYVLRKIQINNAENTMKSLMSDLEELAGKVCIQFLGQPSKKGFSWHTLACHKRPRLNTDQKKMQWPGCLKIKQS